MTDLERMKRCLFAAARRQRANGDRWAEMESAADARKCYRHADKLLRALIVIREAEDWYSFKHDEEAPS